MSTILRALRRLEQEKAQDELVELHDSVVAPPPPKKRRVSTLLVVVCAAVGAAGLGGAAAWQFLGGPSDSQAIDVAAAPELARAEEPSDAVLEQAMAAMRDDQTVVIDARDRNAKLAPAAPAPAAATARQVAQATPEISDEVVVHKREPKVLSAEERRKLMLERSMERRANVGRLRAAPGKGPSPEPAIPAQAPLAAPVPTQAAQPEPSVAATPEPAARPKTEPTPRESAPAVARPAQPRGVPEDLEVSWNDPTAKPPEPKREVAKAVPAPEPEAVPDPEPAPQARVEPEPVVAPTPDPAPQAVPALAADMPTLLVTKTIWHPKGEKRSAFVTVDGEARELREGDRVGALAVSTIKPSGVVFDFEGVELTRRVGESR